MSQRGVDRVLLAHLPLLQVRVTVEAALSTEARRLAADLEDLRVGTAQELGAELRQVREELGAQRGELATVEPAPATHDSRAVVHF